MKHTGTVTICTERLVLRRLTPQDAAALCENGCLGPTAEEAEKTVLRIISHYDDLENYSWGLEYNGRVVGRIAVCELSRRDESMQLAYDIGSAYRNMGLMSDAMTAVIDYLFDQVGTHRIWYRCSTHNYASARVLQKVGMVFEGRLREYFAENDGTYSDVDLYGILREDRTVRSDPDRTEQDELRIDIVVGDEQDRAWILQKYPPTEAVIGRDGYLVVARSADEIIGFAYVFRRPIPAPLPEGYTEDFINVIEVFDTNMHNRGIGSRIVAKCIEVAEKSGSYQLQAYCDIGNIASHRLWLKNGFCISPVKQRDGSIQGSFVTYKLQVFQ